MNAKLNEIFFFLAFVLLGLNFITYAFFQYGDVKVFVRLVSLILLFFSYLLKGRYTFFEFFWLVVCFYILIMGGNMSMNIVFALIMAMSFSERIEKFYKKNFFFSLSMLIFVLATLFLRIVPNVEYVLGGRIRNTLGFYNVNAASLFFFSFLCSFLLKEKNISFFHAFFCLLISQIVYSYTDSRTSTLGIVAYLLICFLFPHIPFFLKKITSCCFVIFVFTSPFFWITPVLNNPVVDKILSERSTAFFRYFFENSQFNLFFGGSNVPDVDNFYLLLLFNVGIFVYLAVCAVVVKSVLNLIKQERNYELAFLFSVMLVGLMESSALRSEILCMSLFWILIFNSLKEGDCNNLRIEGNVK